MKIKCDSGKVRFDSLSCGDVLVDEEGDVWMVCESIDDCFNAVLFDSGSVGLFFLDDMVTPKPNAVLLLDGE